MTSRPITLISLKPFCEKFPHKPTRILAVAALVNLILSQQYAVLKQLSNMLC